MPMSNQQTQGSSSTYGALIADLKNTVTTQLSELMNKMFKEAPLKLLDMAEEAAFSQERDTYYMLKKKLQEYSEDITAEFEDNLLSLMRPYTVTQAEESAHRKEDEVIDDNLSLVAQDDIEDMVLLKNLSIETTAKFRDPIANLEIRLDHLALKTTEIFAKNAVSPAQLCQAFDDTLMEQFELDERKIIFVLFKLDFAHQLGDFYDDMNNKLIAAGVLPKITAQARGGRRRGRATPSPQPVETPVEMPVNPDGMTDAGGYYGDPGGYAGDHGGGYAPGMPGAMPSAPAGMPGAAPGGMPGAPAGMPGAAPGGMPGAPAGMPGVAPGGMPGAPAGMPGAAPGGMPGAPAGMPGAAPSGMPGAPAGMPDAAPGGVPGAPWGGGPLPPQSGVSLGSYAAGQTATPGSNYGNPAAGPGYPADGQAGPTGGGFSGMMPPPNEHGVYQHHTAGMAASHISQAIGNYLGAPLSGGGANAAHGGQEVPAYPVSTAQYFGHDEIISALSSIQTQPQFAENNELRFDADAIKQALLASIAKSSGGIVTKSINQIAEKTIDFIELIFDAIIEDENISDTIKALLLRLQIPVIKASMLDQEFFIYDDHPARILLDRITEVGMGVTEHSDEVYIRVDKIVNQLIGEYALDTNTFQNALDKLNDFVKEREAAASAREEEAQRQTLREHARNAVLKSLRNITAGKTLPEAVHGLILKRWPTVMFNHYIENGKENDGWIAIVELLRDVIESVQPFHSAEDFAYLQVEKDNLLARVNELLSRTYKSKKDIQSVVDGLIRTYDEMLDDANYQTEEIETAEQSLVETPREKEPIPPEPAHVPDVTLPSNVMPGMWFQIATGSGSGRRRCKLSVIIVEDEKLIFVTHTGEVVAEKNFREFTEELDDGRSKVIMGHSVFDYALNSVITKLEPTVH